MPLSPGHWLTSLRRLVHTDDEAASLDTTLLLQEIGATVPLSVSRREDVERLRALGRQRFVPVH